jgi:hypothetical protein
MCYMADQKSLDVAPEWHRWDAIATHEIIRGHIPTDQGPGVRNEGWLRIRPVDSGRFVESRTYSLCVLSAVVEDEKFIRDTDLQASWDGAYSSSRLSHNYRRTGRYSETGEHPVLFRANAFVARDTVVEIEGIHFRSGNILGALAMSHGAIDDNAPIQSFTVDPPTEAELRRHREIFDDMGAHAPASRLASLLARFRRT